MKLSRCERSVGLRPVSEVPVSEIATLTREGRYVSWRCRSIYKPETVSVPGHL